VGFPVRFFLKWFCYENELNINLFCFLICFKPDIVTPVTDILNDVNAGLCFNEYKNFSQMTNKPVITVLRSAALSAWIRDLKQMKDL